jgi:hypothetical protein
MQTAIPQYTPIQTGDRVVCASTPYLAWLRAHDQKHFPKLRYDYENLPHRSDKLDRWFWARSEVVEIVMRDGRENNSSADSLGSMARLKSFLGTTHIPIHCLRKIPYKAGEEVAGER